MIKLLTRIVEGIFALLTMCLAIPYYLLLAILVLSGGAVVIAALYIMQLFSAIGDGLKKVFRLS